MEERSYYYLGYIIIAACVFGLVAYILTSSSSEDVVYQDIYLRDFSFLTSTLLSSNENLSLEYTINEEKGNFDLLITKECELRISKKDEQINFKNFYCLNNGFKEVKEPKVNLNVVKFKLNNNVLSLEES